METISMSELKFIHSRNDFSFRKRNKINNLKKINTYKTFNSKEKLPSDKIKGNSYHKSSNIKLIKTPKNFENETSKNKSFNFRYIKQKIPLKFSLYTILAMKKNNIYDKIEKIIKTESNKTIKINNINNNKNKEYIKTNEEIAKKNKNLIESKRKSIIYLSFLKKNFNESEKIRYYSMLKKLSTLKYILEIEPNNKFKILQNFLLKEGILNKKYLKEECFNNLIKFIKRKKAIINPSFTLKENLINILNNKYDYNLKNIENESSHNDYLRNKKIRNIINLNETIYRNKNTQFHTFENFKINRYDLDLINNLNRQTVILKRTEKQKKFDIVKQPEKILDSVGVELEEQKNDKYENKSYYKWKRNMDINLDNGYNSDIDIFKKKHLMTEFACFIKAKDNYNFNQIKTKYNI